ncbi:hypothetical protein MP228_007891 [Amoeboaphelidium protococcarum]|nr:hypothetical protein MP228_007891 [Amoeboaphelidium protococcarum]
MTNAIQHQDGNVEELQYLYLIQKILKDGEYRSERTGTGTKALFAPPQLRFSLQSDTLPLLTTKRVFYKGVVEELLWFVRGETHARTLQEKGVKIWDGNASREFLDSRGLKQNETGDLGPVYGFQWRHFGAEYQGHSADYSSQGVDQLRSVIEKILRNPTDRRIIISAWNPAALDKMALPPCHLLCQFYVSNPGSSDSAQLSCQMYQRSCDVGLGVPFNIASYSLLTHILAEACGLKAKEFVHVMGDAHIYVNHEQALLEQVQREPTAFPKIRIKKSFTKPVDIKNVQDHEINAIVHDIEQLTMDDFELIDYNPQGKIVMQMAV